MTMAQYGTVLVFEDNPLVAMDAEETLRGKGFRRVIAASSEEAALDLANEERLDFALVAATILDGAGAAIAARLAARSIPFAFSCNFADGSDIPAGWGGTPFLIRPYSEQDVSALLARLQL